MHISHILIEQGNKEEKTKQHRYISYRFSLNLCVKTIIIHLKIITISIKKNHLLVTHALSSYSYRFNKYQV